MTAEYVVMFIATPYGKRQRIQDMPLIFKVSRPAFLMELFT